MTKTNIEWTEETWNPIVGCSVTSPGCTNCYAMKMAARLEAMHVPAYAGTTQKSKAGPVWTGKVALSETALLAPLKRKKPTTWFVNSMGDLFHEDVPDEWIDRVFAVMALCPQHTFQVLTKRSARMREYLGKHDCSVSGDSITFAAFCMNGAVRGYRGSGGSAQWPLPNVWLGATVVNQDEADRDIPKLLNTPAALRFLSIEPMLGPVDLTWIAQPDGDRDGVIDALLGCDWIDGMGRGVKYTPHRPGHEGRIMTRRVVSSEADILANRKIDWVICGGESGPGSRPMHPDWARSLRDQCAAAAVPFFFKQWGDWLPIFEQPWNDIAARDDPAKQSRFQHVVWENDRWEPMNGCWDDSDNWYVAPSYFEPEQELARVGKKAAGRVLDGVEHDGFPKDGRNGESVG